MQNFLNSNEIYPILDLIKGEIRRERSQGNRKFFKDLPDYDDHDVEEMQVLRDGEGSISSVLTRYYDGTTETLTLTRGYSPPVPNTVPDWKYINTRLLMGYDLEIISPELGDKFIQGVIQRQDGYGRITGLKQNIL